MQYVSDEKRILLGLHPYILAKLRIPDKISVFRNYLIKLLVFIVVADLRMLATTFSIFFNSNFPGMYSLHNIYGHIPQSVHIDKNVA
jgi:hypothetical protein